MNPFLLLLAVLALGLIGILLVIVLVMTWRDGLEYSELIRRVCGD